MGKLPIIALDEWLEWARRTREESVRARPECMRIQLRIWRSGLGKSLGTRNWDRDRWIDRLSIVRKWNSRHQADARLSQSGGNNSNCAQPGHRWTNGPDGPRRGNPPRRHRRSRPARFRDIGEQWTRSGRLYAISRRQRPARSENRSRAQAFRLQ